MIEAFSAYIKTIAIFMIFAVFAEIIMPDSNFKKYISIVVGFLMLVTVLKPITAVFGKKGIDFSAVIEAKEVELSNDSLEKQQYKYYEEMSHQYVMDIYEEEMKNKMTQDLNSKGIIVESIQLQIGSEEKNRGRITGVTISVSQEQNKNEIMPVKPVKTKTDDFEKTHDFQKEIQNKVEDFLKEEYAIAPENIYITLEQS